MSESPARWSRVLLKVSGEAFAGGQGHGIDGPDFQQPDRPMSAIGG